MSEEENAKSAEKGKKTVKEEPKMSEDEVKTMVRYLTQNTKYKVLTKEEYNDLTQSKTEKDSKGIPRTLTSTTKSLFLLLNRSLILPPPVSSPNPVTLSSPRIPIFSGEEKNDSSFEVWKFEVKCILREKNYSTPILLQSIRNSLKGKARSLLLSMSDEATPEMIIDKLEGVFGNVYDSEAVIQN